MNMNNKVYKLLSYKSNQFYEVKSIFQSENNIIMLKELVDS